MSDLPASSRYQEFLRLHQQQKHGFSQRKKWPSYFKRLPRSFVASNDTVGLGKSFMGKPKRILSAVVGVLVLIFFIHWILVSLYNAQIRGGMSGIQLMSYAEAMQNHTLKNVNNLFELFPDTPVQIGKITDVKKLASANQIFKKARNGDLVMIYPNQTVIYDPGIKTIVDVSSGGLFR